MTEFKLFEGKPTQVKWKTNLEKVLFCAGMLHVHCFLTDSERAKVQTRIAKRLKEEQKDA